ncbi:MAG: HAMP domain-containing histidine kinase [Nitrososphaeraceae archaeon]|nr:HAMP domain-containing histidine kinase [Nitrososphaeraceae archaeon]
MLSWLHRINSKILSKIAVLAIIEIILIVGSFGMLAYFQSQQSSLGNSINIAGKNRYLTANLLLQIEKYLYGFSSDDSQLKNAMSILESNILTLKQGGNISGMDIKPLPSNLLSLWNSVDGRWNIYKTYMTNKILALPREARATTAKAMDQSQLRNVTESMASTLIESSDKLATSLGQQTDNNIRNLMLLQILFGILIIGILVLILYLVKRMLNPIFALTEATSKVKNGDLDALVKRKGNDELSILTERFNSMMVSMKDHIKRQNQLTKQLEAANEELKQKDRLKDEFINIAAHELRTPIQPILGLSEVIRSRRPGLSNFNMDREGGGEEFIDIIIRNAKRLQSLSENILDITKIESGILKLNKEKFNINEKTRNVINDIKLKENVIRISFDDPKIDPILVEADSLRIYQVMSNLLINAVNSTKKRIIGGSDSYSNHGIQDDCCSSTITVSTTIKKSIDNYEKNNNNSSSISSQDEVIISIIDRGTGIDSDIQDKLFSKFVTKSDAGSGLGLYISKRIVEAHGGRICAKNNSDGNGATFTFSLPVSGVR